jgi:antitoxin VapB
MVHELVAQDWDWLDQVIGPLDDDFVEAALERPAEQIRPALDDIFE